MARQEREPRTPSAKRKPDPPGSRQARDEAKLQRDRAARMARIDAELDELNAIDGHAYEALVRLGMREDVPFDTSSPAMNVLDKLRFGVLRSSAVLRLERYELEQLPRAHPDETPTTTLRRVLVDNFDLSRREAARVAGGFASPADVPPAVRGKAIRDEAKRDETLKREIRDLRKERQAFVDRPAASGLLPFDFRHLAIEQIDKRLDELSGLLSRRRRS